MLFGRAKPPSASTRTIPVGPPPWVSPLLDASGGQALTMAAAALCSFAASVAIYLVTLVLASKLNSWQKLLPWQRVAFAADAVSLAHAAVATPLGVLALNALRSHETASLDCGAGGWASVNLATAPSPDVLVIACGISCGTFLFDCLLLLAYPSECAIRFAAAGGSWIMWLHHTLSVIVWPYCVLTSRAAAFVAWMIATEASNIGQNSYTLAGAAGFEGTPFHMALGIGWLLSFLVFRIIPAPVVVAGYLRLFVAQVGLQDCSLLWELPCWGEWYIREGARGVCRTPLIYVAIPAICSLCRTKNTCPLPSCRASILGSNEGGVPSSHQSRQPLPPLLLPASHVARPAHPSPVLPSVAQDCGLARVDRAVGLLTIPIPLMMNAAWFWEMLKGAAKSLGMGNQAEPTKQAPKKRQ
jgi:hypothetical protein